MKESSNNWATGLFIGVLIGIFIGVWMSPSSKDVEKGWDQCMVVREDYVIALERAQNSISDANYEIENAQSWSWNSYDEMGDALDSLESISLPSDPGTTCY